MHYFSIHISFIFGLPHSVFLVSLLFHMSCLLYFPFSPFICHQSLLSLSPSFNFLCLWSTFSLLFFPHFMFSWSFWLSYLLPPIFSVLSLISSPSVPEQNVYFVKKLSDLPERCNSSVLHKAATNHCSKIKLLICQFSFFKFCLVGTQKDSEKDGDSVSGNLFKKQKQNNHFFMSMFWPLWCHCSVCD